MKHFLDRLGDCRAAFMRRRRTGSMSGTRRRNRAPLGLLDSARMVPPCFLRDLGGDGKTQACAAMFGGVERQEQPLADLIG